MRAQLVLNDRSRRGRELGPAVRDALARAGIVVVEAPNAETVEPGIDAIIGAGGDGTITRCIEPAITHGVPLGIIPLGTFNELARTLEIPLDVAGAVATIARGHERAIDVGYVNGKYFVNEASIGISSRISQLQTSELKQRFGLFAVIGTALQAYRHSRAIHAEIRYDGKVESVRTIQLTVANSHRFGGFLQVAGAAIDDGWLDLYSVDITNFFEAFSIARAMFSGSCRAVPGLRTMRARSFEIRTHHAHHIVADAEPAGTTPATFEVRPKALRVFSAQ